jgi:hypothetical protein
MPKTKQYSCLGPTRFLMNQTSALGILDFRYCNLYNGTTHWNSIITRYFGIPHPPPLLLTNIARRWRNGPLALHLACLIRTLVP